MKSIEEMIAYVQVYIHIRKEKEVSINVNGARDFILLTQAYNIAQMWMAENVKSLKFVA